MKLEKNIKIILTLVLLFALLTYHFLGIKTPETVSEIFKQFDSSIFSISRIIITVVVLILTISSPFIARLFNWNNFIGGRYKGNIIDQNNAANNGQINLTIKQSLISVKVTGVTFKPAIAAGQFVTEYVILGDIVNKDSDMIRFVLELEGQTNRNYGLLTIRFEDKIGLGFLYETNPALKR